MYAAIQFSLRILNRVTRIFFSYLSLLLATDMLVNQHAKKRSNIVRKRKLTSD